MASSPPDQSAAPVCRFDPSSIHEALQSLAEQVEGLRRELHGVDQKVTQLRTVEHANLTQTVKQVRSALDMATRDSKQHLESMSSQLAAAMTRIQSLDLALSNHKLEELAKRVAGRPQAAAKPNGREGGTERVEKEPAS